MTEILPPGTTVRLKRPNKPQKGQITGFEIHNDMVFYRLNISEAGLFLPESFDVKGK